MVLTATSSVSIRFLLLCDCFDLKQDRRTISPLRCCSFIPKGFHGGFLFVSLSIHLNSDISPEIPWNENRPKCEISCYKALHFMWLENKYLGTHN